MTLANKITLVRIMLTPIFLICLIYRQFLPAFLFFLASIISDALDGFFARRRRQITKIGSFIDPVADKSLLIPTYAILTQVEVIPRWLFVILISRDFAILSGWFYSLIAGDDPELQARPRNSGKIAIAVQMVYFLVLMGHLAIPNYWTEVFPAILELGAFIVAAVTFLSFADYLFFGSKTLDAGERKNVSL